MFSRSRKHVPTLRPINYSYISRRKIDNLVTSLQNEPISVIKSGHEVTEHSREHGIKATLERYISGAISNKNRNLEEVRKEYLDDIIPRLQKLISQLRETRNIGSLDLFLERQISARMFYYHEGQFNFLEKDDEYFTIESFHKEFLIRLTGSLQYLAGVYGKDGAGSPGSSLRRFFSGAESRRFSTVLEIHDRDGPVISGSPLFLALEGVQL